MPRNIRNTRRNFARPSGTFTAATSYSSVTFSNGSASSGISITKTTNPLGPAGNGTFRVTSSPSGITGTTVTSGTTATVSFDIPVGVATTSSVFITEDNYNGPGKSVTAPNYTVSGLFTASVLVIGGGGGGGSSFNDNTMQAAGGGGGAGAYREFNNYYLGTGTNFTVTVGAGGAGNAFSNGSTGNQSTFHTIGAAGGGGGGYGASGNTNITNGSAGGSGGSGGGAGGNDGNNSTERTGGTYVAPDSPTIVTNKELYTVTGFSGGLGRSANNNAGGGGGASAAGAAGTSTKQGGAGRASSITGSSVTRAGGGGGSNAAGGAGGGGGNSTANATGASGSANTGGGGGGTVCSANLQSTGGTGGSGVVIIRYPDTRTITIGAGLTGSTATDGSFRVTTITAGSGNVSFA